MKILSRGNKLQVAGRRGTPEEEKRATPGLPSQASLMHFFTHAFKMILCPFLTAIIQDRYFILKETLYHNFFQRWATRERMGS
jgi:hypothetical protein